MIMLDITLSKGSGEDDIRITKKGFIDNTSISTGKLKVNRFIKQGVYSITADLEQKQVEHLDLNHQMKDHQMLVLILK